VALCGGGDVVQTEKMKGIAELDLAGFAATEHDGVWQNAAGVYLRVDFQEGTPTLTHWLENEEDLLKGVAVRLLASGMATIECWIDYPGALPAMFVMFKQHQTAERGRLYTAFYHVPRATCSLTIELWAAEKSEDIGRREKVVEQLMPGRAYVPSPRMPILTTPDGRPMVYDYADSHAVDKMFPDHPLTHLRAALGQVFPSVRFEEWFTALAAYAGSPSASGGGP
jgi:hypothetical protein